ncbi:hypothetical protein HNY73_003750 [Argiope bruennichi]|uniref:Uncharacterized protein n=1 Tax=Argiope bruennichi TaxID=94029 RepID=A0A8T0FLM6_ARGBR|nr:hypothetical protein HNY73_003750 [Argiope bruennichi]
MQSAFEKLLADQEKRRNDFMEQFYKKYTLTEGDSDDELIDFRTFRVIKKKGKLGRKRLQKRVKTKVIKFGEMNSYSISFESKTYLKQIRKYIEPDEACTEKFVQHNDGGESELLVTSNTCTNHTKKDSFKDESCSMSKKSQNKTWPLNFESNQHHPPLSIQYPNNVKLDCLTFKQDKHIKNLKNPFSKIRMLPLYEPYFKYSPKLDVLHEDQTIKNTISEHKIHQESSETKCNDSNMKLSSNSLTLKTGDNNSSSPYKIKECSVVLHRNIPAKYFKPLKSRSDIILSQSIAINPQFNFIKKSMPVNQNDKHAQKPSQKKYARKKLLCKNNTHLTVLKRLRPRPPKAGGTILKPRSYRRRALQVDEIEVSGSADKLQNNSNCTIAEMNDILPSKDICRPQTKTQLKRKLFTDTCHAESVGHQNKSSDAYLTKKSSNNIGQTDLQNSNCTIAEMNDILFSKDICRPQTKTQLKRKLFTNTCHAESVGHQNKSSDAYLNKKSSNNIDQTDLHTTLCMTNSASVSNQTIFPHSGDEQLLPEDRHASLIGDWKNKSLEANDTTVLRRGNIFPNRDLSPLKNFDANNFNSVFPGTAKNLSAQNSSSKNLLENSFVAMNSDRSHIQCSSSDDVTLQHNSDNECLSCISKNKFATEATKHSNIKSCKKISRKLSTDESEGQNNCPKLDNSEADFIKSRHLHLSQKCATVKSGDHPVSRSKHKMSYGKKEFKKNSSSNPAYPENVPNKDSSAPKIIDYCLRPRKMSTYNECPGAEISDKCSKKIVSTPQILKKYSRPRNIFSSNTYPTKNICHPKSVSVTKLNRKCLRNFDTEFKKSQYGKQRDILANSQNNSFDDLHVPRKKSIRSECSVKDELLGVSNIPYKQFFTPQFPKKILPMKPISKSQEFAPNLLMDCLVQN